VLFFPKLLAGPILKYHEMRDQIAKPPAVEWNDLWTGFLRFARGMGRKLLIADPLGAFASQVFAADPGGLSAGVAWLGLGCFTVQIYFDFAGYSDMAIGLARTLGFRLKENFNSPSGTVAARWWIAAQDAVRVAAGSPVRWRQSRRINGPPPRHTTYQSWAAAPSASCT